MLINKAGAEVFHGKTRGQINSIVSGHCKTEACAEKAQAHALAPLREVFIPGRFRISDFARMK